MPGFLPHTPLFLYDTLSRKTQPVTASDGKTVRIYACGPTIYNRAHIGNFRTFLFEDLLRRTLKILGYHVVQVMNLTDVDDKTIKGAIAANESLQTYTEKYAKAFFQDLDSLRIEPVEHYPRATEYIPHMIEMIASLVEKGAAYKASDNSVYYKVSACKEYGKLSHFHLHELQEGASGRVSSDEYDKEGASDFVLWKAYDLERDGDIYWESPWGKGRPGWHIECSVMAKVLLGKTIDLHVGGVDLIFPHHENEIAQSETSNGCCFSSHWAHAEHLLVDSKKMSKSLGNFYTLDMLFDKGYSAEALRFFLMGTHYRTQLNFTLEGLQAAESAIRRIKDTYQRLKSYTSQKDIDLTSDEIVAIIQEERNGFIQALSKDLNINEALAHFFDMIRKINSSIDSKTLTSKAHEMALLAFHDIDAILDILRSSSVEERIPADVLELSLARVEARAKKNWAESDRLRTALLEKGYTTEDTPQGQKISKAIPHVAKISN